MAGLNPRRIVPSHQSDNIVMPSHSLWDRISTRSLPACQRARRRTIHRAFRPSLTRSICCGGTTPITMQHSRTTHLDTSTSRMLSKECMHGADDLFISDDYLYH